jgi:photosystem II stability/assembly factor-like uncharacterized protein
MRSRQRFLCLTALLWPVASTPSWAAGFFVPEASPEGDAIALAAAPNGTLYAATSASIYALGPESETWAPRGAQPGPITTLQVAPSRELWALGANATFVSDDDGISWSEAPSPGAVIQHIAFEADGGILAATSTGLYRSARRGEPWQLLSLTTSPVGPILVRAAGEIWTSVADVLFVSHDGGSHWTRVAALGAAPSILVAHPTDGVYVTFPHDIVFHVTTLGSFSPVGALNHEVLDIFVVPNGLLCACVGAFDGYRDDGGIYRTTDNGDTWRLVSGPAHSTSTFVARPDGSVFALCGAGGTICPFDGGGVLRSTDSGGTWAPFGRGLGRAWVSSIVVDANGPNIVAAAGGEIWSSVDRGATWNQLADVYPLHCEARLPEVTARGGVVVATAPDGGLHVVSRGISYLFPDVFSTPVLSAHGTLVAVLRNEITTLNPPLFNSSTAARVSPQGPVRFIVSGPSRRLVAAGPGGTYLSDDDGMTWTQIANIGGPVTISSDERTLLVAEGPAVFQLRENNGWLAESTPPISTVDVLGVLFDGLGSAYALTADRVFRLFPAGSAWQDLGGADGGATHTSFAFGLDGTLHVATSAGLWRSAGALGEITDATPPSSDGLVVMGAVPNPARSGAEIAFSIARRGRISLVVYDVRGRVIATLLRGDELEAGFHTTRWEPRADVPNGVYEYRLTTGRADRSGRLVLAR